MESLTDSTWRCCDRFPYPELRAPRAAARRLRRGPGGERLERIRRSPNFADGVFQNPVGARTRPSTAPCSSSRRSTSARRSARAAPPPAPCRCTPRPSPTSPSPPASGLRLTWMGHSSVLAEIDGQPGALRPGLGRALLPVRLRRSQAAAPGARCRWPRSARSMSSSSRTTTTTTSTCPRSRRWPTRTRSSRCRSASAPTWSTGASPRTGCASWTGTRRRRSAGISLTATPARHFCGRGLRNTQHTLWASWVGRGRRAPDLPQR